MLQFRSVLAGTFGRKRRLLGIRISLLGFASEAGKLRVLPCRRCQGQGREVLIRVILKCPNSRMPLEGRHRIGTPKYYLATFESPGTRRLLQLDIQDPASTQAAWTGADRLT